jgi:hypothetical protein
LKILAAEEEGKTLNALVVEALNDLLVKYAKKPTIENPLIDRNSQAALANHRNRPNLAALASQLALRIGRQRSLM